MDENKIVVREKYETEYWAKSMSIGSVQKIELKAFWGKKQKEEFSERTLHCRFKNFHREVDEKNQASRMQKSEF